MNATKTTTEMKDKKVMLSTLWLFAMLNYTYGDVVTLMDPVYLKGLIATGAVGGPSNHSRIPVGSLHIPGDSDCDGSPVSDIEVSGKSLGEHHRRYDNDCCSDRDAICCGANSPLCIFLNYRNCVYCIYCLVCMEMA